MLVQGKQVAIVGGGPGGLILARLLQLKGVEAKVYERDSHKNARVQGSPLDLHENSGLAALRAGHLLEAFKKNYLPGADKKIIANEKAEVFFSDHATKQEENFGHEHFRPEIDRGALRKIVLDSLQSESVVWDSHFVSMDRHNEGWLLHFKNGTSAYADVVIGADGANSKIRPYVTDIASFYTGITMLEGNVPNAVQVIPKVSAILQGGKIMAFGNKKDLLMGQKADGFVGFYISFTADEHWASTCGLDFSNKAQLLEWFKKEYAGWSEVWHELIENTEIPLIPRPIHCMPLDQTWETKANLTLIGDAAHVMPPFAGEGVNMAMLDALELSECLTDHVHETTQAAIRHYEVNMRKRASEMAHESLENGKMMHSANALATMLEFFSGHAPA
jgi:2-polyprenyl-6-methoxyphenol hydroxylase-like FAD-dependent oxidoreductase